MFGKGKKPPLTCKQVKKGLAELGFKYRNTEGSHENWVPEDESKPFRKVTVDCPKAPFDQFLIASMARQADVTKAKFYEACLK